MESVFSSHQSFIFAFGLKSRALETESENHYFHYFFPQYSVMEVMKQLDQGEIAATARARLHGDMVPPRNDVQVSRPQAPRPMPPTMNPAFTYPGKLKGVKAFTSKKLKLSIRNLLC